MRRAWKEEKNLVKETGYGTRRLSPQQQKELLTTGKVKGFQGHHIYNVEKYDSWKTFG